MYRLRLFAVTLAAYQQEQQRSMAVWTLIRDGYDDDSELDAENDESTREIKRRRVYQRKYYKPHGCWQELQDEDLSDHTSRAARRFRGEFRVPYTVSSGGAGEAERLVVRAKLCVACCPCLLTVCCVWGEYDGACLNSLGCSLGAPQHARHFIF